VRKEKNMNEMIKVNFENAKPTVSARELHSKLQIGTDFRHWFYRVTDLGFQEQVDYVRLVQTCTTPGGPQEMVDYALSLDMAKHICMLLRNEKGMQYRQYFLELEKAWNRPEAVMARALQLANETVNQLRQQNLSLGNTIQEQERKIAELTPKAKYVDQVLQSPSLVLTTQIAKDYGMSAVSFNRKLSSMGIQYRVGTQWVLYARYQNKGYVHSRTIVIPLANGASETKMQTEWTQKGRLFLYAKLKAEGILPLLERGGDA
jgi:anti-repressor protein